MEDDGALGGEGEEPRIEPVGREATRRASASASSPMLTQTSV